MKDFQYITNSHPSYIENLYNDFIKNPESVDLDMRKFFEGFDFAVSSGQVAAVSSNVSTTSSSNLNKEFAVYQLIDAYRKKGHLVAKTNPIRERKNRNANLDLQYFGLSDADLNTNFEVGQFLGLGKASLKNILDYLQKSYTTHVGLEYGHITDSKKIEWLINATEKTLQAPVSLDQKKEFCKS